MRQLTDHIVSGDQASQLTVQATGEIGKGGENSRYLVRGYWPNGLPDWNGLSDIQIDTDGGVTATLAELKFQFGPIPEVGVNGTTNEVLIAIVMDRLRAFQNGPFNCSDNEEALEGCTKALHALQRRTVARIKRGVEGTHQK